MRKGILISFILAIVSFGNAQNSPKIDSLKLVLTKLKSELPSPCPRDTEIVKTLLSLGYLYEYNLPDSAIICYNSAIEASDKIDAHKLKSMACNWKGIVFQNQGNLNEAIESYKHSLESFILLSHSDDSLTSVAGISGIAKCYNNIGLVYDKLGNFKNAIKNYQQSLKVRESLLTGDSEKDKDIMNGIAECYNNIGMLNDASQSYERAIEYYEKSLQIHESAGNKSKIAACYNNLGVVYHELATRASTPEVALVKLRLASNYYNNSLEIFKEFVNSERQDVTISGKDGLAHCYNNLGMISQEEGNYFNEPDVREQKHQEAIDYYIKSLVIKEELGDKYGIASSLGNIGSLHAAKAKRSENPGTRKREYLEAIEYADKALEIAIEIESVVLRKHSNQILFLAYKGLRNYEKALNYMEEYMIAKDTIYNTEKTRAIEDMEARYHSEKRQLQIQNLENEKSLQAEVIQKQRLSMFAMIIGLALILAISILLARLFVIKRKANRLLALRNYEINQKNEEITSQRDEIENQRDILQSQKEEIEDSIHYARRIQGAVLPSSEKINRILKDHFIIFKPKDIVSGDFYWTTNIGHLNIIAVADCTGHGVPGAFMSMLGIAFLNEIVRKAEISNSGMVLDHLRNEVIESLHQNPKSNKPEAEGKGINTRQKIPLHEGVKDGLDIALCIINTQTLELQFSGAHNPVYILRDGAITELKGNKMPVAIYLHMHKFDTYNMQLHEGDVLYMFTDGFIDQFGGDKGKKLKHKRLRTILKENSTKPLEEQKNILESALKKWMSPEGMGAYEQIDDITVIGMKIPAAAGQIAKR